MSTSETLSPALGLGAVDLGPHWGSQGQGCKCTLLLLRGFPASWNWPISQDGRCCPRWLGEPEACEVWGGCSTGSAQVHPGARSWGPPAGLHTHLERDFCLQVNAAVCLSVSTALEAVPFGLPHSRVRRNHLSPSGLGVVEAPLSLQQPAVSCTAPG